jgi:CHASE2 domain-containing sensor protein
VGQSVVLNLGKGNWQQGFPWVIAQLREANSLTSMQFTGSLPPAPELEELHPCWQSFYNALYSGFNWRRLRHITTTNVPGVVPDIEIDESDITNVSDEEFQDLCRVLREAINQWLESSEFRKIDQYLRTRLDPDGEVQLIITAEDSQVLRLPWCLWQFLDDYPKAEVALGPLEYRRSIRKEAAAKSSAAVKILAILGNQDGIDVEQDQRLLEQLPQADLHFLVEPDRTTLNQVLWEPGWDILFFAGHSSSQGKGRMQINRSESITIDQLKYGLKHAIAHGLKLAIFNSCDGLGLAQDLADLSIPQVIVMREPVVDQVAQEFLKHFLNAFSQGQSLYTAVREAREKLQALESEFPCATWLPVICQNPAEESIRWQDLCPAAEPPATISPPARSAPAVPGQWPSWRRWAAMAATSLVVSGLVLGVRSLGLLESIELWGFDRLLRLRPEEEADSRLVVITIDDDDIRAQTQTERRGSLADETLNQLLEQLEQANVAVIGLDVYRDYSVSAGQTSLARRLQQSDRLISICKSVDVEADPAGVAPPPEVPDDRLGFSDFIKDDDGILRRHLLVITPDPASACATPYAFSAQIAFEYFSDRNYTASFTPDGDLKIGDTVFPRLQNRTGGYQPTDAGGNQILLNYRALPSLDKIASQISLRKLLSGEVNLDALKDKIVLIGVTAASSGDYWATPYGTASLEEVAGVFIQAHMVSQILSVVLDGRSLLWTLPWWGDGLWILSWSLVGGLAGIYLRRMPLAIVTVTAVGVLSGCCFVILMQGGWIAWIPAGIALIVTGTSVAYVDLRLNSHIKPPHYTP